jgi:murein DD-endopeptidase MepM/ murein hydrolase activator NlpD
MCAVAALCLGAPWADYTRSEARAEAPAAPQQARAKGPASRRARGNGSAAPRRKGAAQLRAERLGLGNLRAAGKLLAGAPEPSWVPGKAAVLFGTLRFPVTGGGMVRGFGSGAGGYHQAMDIAGKPGTKVQAAAPGLVGYAGSEVSGYGNLVLLVHDGGAVTAYAHNQRNLVVAGQHVDRGSVIALLGSTGRSQGPHVHFELLYGGQNCDPGPLFRPAVRSPRNVLVGYPAALWRKPGKRPKSVHCAPRKHHPDYVRGKPHEPDEDAPTP